MKQKVLSRSVNQMEQEQEKKGTKPTYKGDGIAVWKNTHDSGKEYLSIKLVGHQTIYAWENKTETPSDTIPNPPGGH